MAARGKRKVSLIVPGEVGLHARPAVMLVKLAQAYEADIHIEHNRVRVNAKSVLGILALGAQKGSEVTVIADGEDAEDAIEAITRLFAGCFADEEVHRKAEGVTELGQHEGVGWHDERSRRVTAVSAAPRA